MTDHSPCFPHFLLLNEASKSSSRTDEIRHYDCHVKFENNTSGRARLWDTALKFLCPGLSITSPDHLAVSINLKKKRETSAERDRNACREGSLHLVRGKTWRSIQGLNSSRFPNFEASDAWQMGHNSQEGFFLGQELLLDFTAWIDLTSNADNTITVYQLPSKFQNTF